MVNKCYEYVISEREEKRTMKRADAKAVKGLHASRVTVFRSDPFLPHCPKHLSPKTVRLVEENHL